MNITLEEVKEWLRVDGDEDNAIIFGLIMAAENYLKNATGKEFSEDNQLAKLFCFILITDWYENRDLTGSKIGEKIRSIVQSMLLQLQYSEGVENSG